jgi:hypothetical protein
MIHCTAKAVKRSETAIALSDARWISDWRSYSNWR